jgi:hypothetical protein
MSPEQEAHLQAIKEWICERIDKKYREGQKTHGGNLWAKPFVFEMLLDEVTDLITYAYTHKQHLSNPSMVDPSVVDK